MSDLWHTLGAIAPASVLALALLAGAALGLMFFGGLWWTARRGLASPHPALWVFGSLLLRMGLTLPGFVVVAAGRWERLLACLLGFAAARAFVTWRTRPPRAEPPQRAQGATHAS